MPHALPWARCRGLGHKGRGPDYEGKGVYCQGKGRRLAYQDNGDSTASTSREPDYQGKGLDNKDKETKLYQGILDYQDTRLYRQIGCKAPPPPRALRA